MSARRLREGDGSVCLLAVGKLVAAALEAADELAREGVEVTVWDVRVVSPPDPELLADAARHRHVITAEDGMRQGGAGMFLADALAAVVRDQNDLNGVAGPTVDVLGIPRRFIAQGKPDAILAALGLDGPGLARSVRRALETDTAATATPDPLRVD
jgi:1-deoxy-D-xylulose-5-phosphate synthase